MSDLSLNASWDIDLKTGDAVVLEPPESISQQMSIRLRMFVGEYFLDQRAGFPWLSIVGQKPRISLVASLVREAIITTPRVIEIKNMVVDYTGSTRSLAISFDALVEDEATPIQFSDQFIINNPGG